MHHRWPAFLLCSLSAAILAHCEGNSSDGPDGGTHLKDTPFQLCLGWCYFHNEHCGRNYNCLEACGREMRNARGICEPERGAKFQCELDVFLKYGCVPPAGSFDICLPALVASDECLRDHGCNDFESFGAEPCGPTALHACGCYVRCNPHLYETRCDSELTTGQCECLMDDVLAGTCSGGSEPICDVWTGCCKQFFNLQ